MTEIIITENIIKKRGRPRKNDPEHKKNYMRSYMKSYYEKNKQLQQSQKKNYYYKSKKETIFLNTKLPIYLSKLCLQT